MMIRILIGLLVLGQAAFATCDRGSRLISEAGGIAAIAGVATPEDSPSLAGAVGISDISNVPPVQTIPTIPSAPGILDFAEFFAVMPTDNPTPISGNGTIQFPRDGSNNGVIKRASASSFILPTAGTYLVLFNASVTGAGQLMLRLYSTEPQTNTVVGRNQGNTQIVGFGLVTTLVSDTLIDVINPPGNAAITLTPNAGSNAARPVTAHLVIIRIQ